MLKPILALRSLTRSLQSTRKHDFKPGQMGIVTDIANNRLNQPRDQFSEREKDKVALLVADPALLTPQLDKKSPIYNSHPNTAVTFEPWNLKIPMNQRCINKRQNPISDTKISVLLLRPSVTLRFLSKF